MAAGYLEVPCSACGQSLSDGSTCWDSDAAQWFHGKLSREGGISQHSSRESSSWRYHAGDVYENAMQPAPPRHERPEHSAPRRRASRVRMFCPICDFESFLLRSAKDPHCLKCGAILEKPTSSCAEGDGSRLHVSHARHLPAEVSTFEQLLSGEWESGHCRQSPHGMHHWKFGKCHYCQQPEGQIWHTHAMESEFGGQSPHGMHHWHTHAMESELGGKPRCAIGGKCTFALEKCTKCGYGKESCSVERRSSSQDHHLTAPVPQNGPITWKSHTQHVSSSAVTSQAAHHCKHSPTGAHQWRFGKCHHCQKPEGYIMHGSKANESLGSECLMGGKCKFKFAECIKCGRGEGILSAEAFVARHAARSTSVPAGQGVAVSGLGRRTSHSNVNCGLRLSESPVEPQKASDEVYQGGCESVPVGGGLRAIRKLHRSRHHCDSITASEDEEQSTSAGSDDEVPILKTASEMSDDI